LLKGPKVMLISALAVLALAAIFHFGPLLLADSHIFFGTTARGLQYTATSSSLEFLLLALIFTIVLFLGLRHSWKTRRKRRSKQPKKEV
jgi:DMSO/TMAO reductase YedYZ heme-binding membrane subunit